MNAETVPCPTCQAAVGNPCVPTGTATAEDEWWQEYRRATPHSSREMRAAERANEKATP